MNFNITFRSSSWYLARSPRDLTLVSNPFLRHFHGPVIRASGWRRRAEQGILRRVIRGLFHNGLDGAKQTDLLRNQTWRIVGEAAISETGWSSIDHHQRWLLPSGNEALLTSSTLKRSSEHEQQECEAQSIHQDRFDVLSRHLFAFCSFG